jgi:hypothetical protein
MVVDALRVGKLPGTFGVVERPLPGGQFAWLEVRRWAVCCRIDWSAGLNPKRSLVTVRFGAHRLTPILDLTRWCLGENLRIIQTMTLMTIGFYNEPNVR